MPLDPALVAAHLGLAAADERVTAATMAAESWTQRRRSLTDPDTLWAEPDTVHGAVIYAALIYQSRAQPDGFPGYSDLGTADTSAGEAMANVYRLVGSDPVIA